MSEAPATIAATEAWPDVREAAGPDGPKGNAPVIEITIYAEGRRLAKQLDAADAARFGLDVISRALALIEREKRGGG